MANCGYFDCFHAALDFLRGLDIALLPHHETHPKTRGLCLLFRFRGLFRERSLLENGAQVRDLRSDSW